jgi:hypothetical protein
MKKREEWRGRGEGRKLVRASKRCSGSVLARQNLRWSGREAEEVKNLICKREWVHLGKV